MNNLLYLYYIRKIARNANSNCSVLLLLLVLYGLGCSYVILALCSPLEWYRIDITYTSLANRIEWNREIMSIIFNYVFRWDSSLAADEFLICVW